MALSTNNSAFSAQNTQSESYRIASDALFDIFISLREGIVVSKPKIVVLTGDRSLREGLMSNLVKGIRLTGLSQNAIICPKGLSQWNPFIRNPGTNAFIIRGLLNDIPALCSLDKELHTDTGFLKSQYTSLPALFREVVEGSKILVIDSDFSLSDILRCLQSRISKGDSFNYVCECIPQETIEVFLEPKNANDEYDDSYTGLSSITATALPIGPRSATAIRTSRILGNRRYI